MFGELGREGAAASQRADMNEKILDLKMRVYQLTGDFSRAATSAVVALNTPPLTEETLGLVRECRAVGRGYGEALDALLAALREEGLDPEEVARATQLKELLGRELGLVNEHPALRT